MKFQRDQIIVEGFCPRIFGIILQSGDVTYDVVWVGGSTSRYRYDTGRDVRVATADEITEESRTIEHLRQEAETARQERRSGARIKRGQVWPSR